MSIYVRRFSRYEGKLEPPRGRFRVILLAELRRIFADKWWRRFLFGAAMPAVMMAGWLYLMTTFQEATGAELDFPFFSVLFGWQFSWLGIMQAWFGASMITGDMHTKALSLYFTRPIDATQYLLGKLGATMALALTITWIPSLLVAVVQYSVADHLTFGAFAENVWSITACSMGAAFTTSALILLLSSTGLSARYVGITWLGAFVFLEAIRGILYESTGRSEALDVLSLARLLSGSVEYYFLGASHKLGSVITLWGVGALLTLILRIRLSGFEKARS